MNDICLLTVQVHVIGTLLSQVLPALFPPCYVFREVGPVIVSGEIREELLCVSSDGVIVLMETTVATQMKLWIMRKKLQ